MDKKILIANWKENPNDFDTAKKLLEISTHFSRNNKQYTISHAVPSIFAGLLKKEDPDAQIILENISQFEEGAHTGEISASQAKNLKINSSIVGHSETRLSPENPHGDEDKDVNEKIKKLLEKDMGVVLCVGEYKRDESYKSLIEEQITKCLAGIKVEDIEKIIIAYEPIWAIGKKAARPATNEEIIEAIGFIKNIFEKKNIEIPILYGGSVDDKNASQILELPNVSGLLIGRASSQPQMWVKILQSLDDTTRSMSELAIKENSKVILRLDLNVPTDEKGNIANYFRVDEALSTILSLQKKRAKIIILAHKEEGTLLKVSQYLQTKLDNFQFINLDFVNLNEIINSANSGSIFLLENIRLDKREKNKDEKLRDELGQELATLGDFYVNEAFSASHRDHASITSIPKFFSKENKALGPKFVTEIEKLSLALTPKHPMLLLVGGAKFDTKLPMLEKFLKIADNIFVGGALAHSFWKEKFKYNLGKSLLDEEIKLSEDVLNTNKIILPIDVVVESREEKTPDKILDNERVVDFGFQTFELLRKQIDNSNTVVWNGPVGYYEGGYDEGTKRLLIYLAEQKNIVTILGGGDTVTEIDKLNSERVRENRPKVEFTHVSTGGGAMIEFLSNGTLPGIEAIKK